ncbi:MAG: DUF1896 domain-containing protein [Prevotellaceae bacterium]|jgi:hypothetical protein|nr:DUF1896 domain-containing protein [Prevotellaceae bacterium]
MSTQKYTTVAEIAQAIGANYYGLTLLSHLEQYYPELALDFEFIKKKAACAAEVAAEYVGEHGTDGFSQIEAKNRALDELLGGFGFSKFEVAFRICTDILYAALGSHELTASHERQRQLVMCLQPKLEPIFEKYPLDDPEFPASCAYDDFEDELKKAALRLLQPDIEAARDKVDMPF